MKKGSIIFLQAVIILTGIGALVLLILEPQVEGRNAHATLFEIYFKDPFLALVYTGSIPFFAALYQAFNLLRYAGENKIFSKEAVKSMRIIKYCALAIIGFVFVEEIFIILNHGNDDAAGGIVIGILITFGSIVAAAAANVFERILRSAADIKAGKI